MKSGKLSKQIGDPEIKQFYREIRPGNPGIDQQKNRTTSENKLSAQKKVQEYSVLNGSFSIIILFKI